MLLFFVACATTGAPAVAPDADHDGARADVDCDDADAAVHPDAADDTCDGVDQDCDGFADEGAPDARTWYADTDGDGFGDFDAPFLACGTPAAATLDFTDCDDTDATVHPDNVDDTCDNVDTDCDGDFDEDAAETTLFYADADGDGHGDPWDPVIGCTLPPGAAAAPDDCDDTSAAAHPGGDDACGDGIDGDCDGVADKGCGDTVHVQLDAFPRLYGDDTDAVYYDSLSRIGMRLAFGGDLDGDGAPELALGMPHTGNGRVYLFEHVPDGTTFAAAGTRLDGTDDGAAAGGAVAWARLGGEDVLLVGAHGYEDGGAVYVVRADGGLDSAAHLVGDRSSQAGAAVAGGALLEEADAVAIGAPGLDGDVGGVYVASAVGDFALDAAPALLRGESGIECAGEALAVTDLDGDGWDDLVVGAVGDCTYSASAGVVWVAHGPFQGVTHLGDADARLHGSSGAAGATIVALGDVEGDGRPDVAVAAPDLRTHGGGVGVVYLLTGDPDESGALDELPYRVEGADADLGLGLALADAGDVDDDGRADLLCGVPSLVHNGSYDGGALLVTRLAAGVQSTDDVASRIYGAPGATAWGAAVAAGQDLDGDGAFDLAVGSLGSDDYDAPDAYQGTVVVTSTLGWFGR